MVVMVDLIRALHSYWGQNSYGATHASNTADFQKNLSAYCQVRHRKVQPLPQIALRSLL